MNVDTLWCAFHVDKPVGNQASKETAYPNYERQSIDGYGWVFSDGVFTNRTPMTFPNPLKHSVRITHFSLGTAKDGPGHLRVIGPLDFSAASPDQESVAFHPGTIRVNVHGGL